MPCDSIGASWNSTPIRIFFRIFFLEYHSDRISWLPAKIRKTGLFKLMKLGYGY